MFWLAGILGLLAVGSVAFVSEEGSDAEEDATDEQESAPADEGTDLLNMPPETPETPVSDGTAPDGRMDSVVADLILPGSEAAETLAGGAGDDQINGYDGDDLIEGDEGDDDIHGAGGDDTLAGGEGDDIAHGEDGDDRIGGGAGNDSLHGHYGDDTLAGGDGVDSLNGGAGNDLLDGEAGDDALHGGLGDDTLTDGAGEDTLFGGWGDDVVSGRGETHRGGTDFLNGGGGDDTLIAGEDDVLTGGEGADSFVLGAWIGQDHAAELTDYDAERDQLVLIWDLAAPDGPQIDVIADETAPGFSRVLVNGTEIAQVRGSRLSASDIILVDPADAPAFGLAT